MVDGKLNGSIHAPSKYSSVGVPTISTKFSMYRSCSENVLNDYKKKCSFACM
jgi:hypothetical protein